MLALAKKLKLLLLYITIYGHGRVRWREKVIGNCPIFSHRIGGSVPEEQVPEDRPRASTRRQARRTPQNNPSWYVYFDICHSNVSGETTERLRRDLAMDGKRRVWMLITSLQVHHVVKTSFSTLRYR